MQQNNTQGTPNRTNLIIVVVVVIAAALLLPRIFGSTSTPSTTTNNPTIPQQQNPVNSDTTNIQLGAPVSAVGIDRNGCATETTRTFSGNESIYVIAPNSNVPQGTTVFARLYRDNTPIEDTPQITADKDYIQNCINFVFQPTGADFAPGTYEAQFFVNGNAASSVTFNVQ
ncbi:MAG: hypothetical protein GC179_06025 [Anaerolineaceae bacterium]|nr:hypothetical protein [Anaerolineaceae bacterium]